MFRNNIKKMVQKKYKKIDNESFKISVVMLLAYLIIVVMLMGSIIHLDLLNLGSWFKLYATIFIGVFCFISIKRIDNIFTE